MVVALALAAACAACAAGERITTTNEAVTATTTAASTSTLPPVVECPGTGEFEEGTGIAEFDSIDSDASDLGEISWSQSDQCETFMLEFETPEGAPATTVPTLAVGHLPSYQIIRIAMDVESSALTDQLVETGLVDRLYVVRALDGGMFVDLHLTAPAAARVNVRSSPAVLVVDLRPGFIDFSGHAVIHDKVVVVTPSAGATIGVSSNFSGYSRTSDGEVKMIATSGDEVVSETGTSAAGSGETWGEFSVDLTLPQGEMSVFLGEESPEDDGLEGVTLDLTVR